MNGLNRITIDKKFNLSAIECLEQIGLSSPTLAQIETVKKFLQRAGQTGKGRGKFTRPFMRQTIMPEGKIAEQTMGCLYLMRYKGEAIKIGEDVTVRVSQTRDNSVILKIDAPKEVPVDRMEIYEQKRLQSSLEKHQPEF